MTAPRSSRESTVPMDAGVSASSFTDRFAAVIPGRAGSGGDDDARDARHDPERAEVELPEFVGGSFQGPLVILSGEPVRKIAAIKALRGATGNGLHWAKSVVDRVSAGYSLTVSVHDEGLVDQLAQEGWRVELAQADGARSLSLLVRCGA
jgi:ribosomal protein L7/L12